MAERSAKAVWKGDLKNGNGEFTTTSTAIGGKYTFATRFGEEPGTNPEELIAAAHASCFSMALSNELAQAGHVPTSVTTTAKVHLTKSEDGFAISLIELDTEGVVPGIDEGTFLEHAEKAKVGCPISKVLSATKIELKARLVS